MALVIGLPGANAAGLTVLRIGAQPVDSSAQVFYAKERGLFAAAGIDAELTVLANGQELVTGVVSGSLDVGLSAVGSVAAAREKGLAVKFIAPAGLALSSASTDALMIAKDSTVHDGADLIGKTVGVNGLGNVVQYATQAWIDQHGGDSRKVKYVEIPFPLMADALAQHRVDAATLVEPYVAEARNVARQLGDPFAAIAPHFMSTGWFATDAWLEKNLELANRFVAVMRESAQWANAHHAESAEILIRATKIKPETAASMTRSVYGTDLDPAQIQPAIDAGVKYGDIDHPLAAREIIWKKK